MNNLTPDDCIFFLLTRGSLSVTSIFKKILAKKELSEIKPSYLGALMCLWEMAAMDEVLGKFGSKDGMKLTELGRCAGVEPSTITGLVDRMEKDGLAYRSSVPNDRRAQQANLTDKGCAIRNKVYAALEDLTKEAFEGIAKEDMKITKKVLRRVIANAANRKKS